MSGLGPHDAHMTNAIDTAAPTNTNTHPSNTGTDAGSPAGTPPMIDARPAFASAVAIGRGVLASLDPAQFELPTPCPEFDVRTLASHLVAVLRRIAVIGRREDAHSVGDFADEIAPQQWLQAYDEFAAQAIAVWRDDTLLPDILNPGWATMPGAAVIMIYTSEVTVHTWDLAVATGQSPAWDDDVIAIGLAAMQRGLPAEGRMERFGVIAGQVPAVQPPFRDAVRVDPRAQPIETLVAWCGRTPVTTS
ncbi:MAG: hypothetical protein JWN39_2817 [Ilumatobacteraceae bacterium]|nr:hypothetical protein [Ilumatobacteraceae bacterium]